MSVNIPEKAYGTMSLTWTPTPPPKGESLKILKYLYEKKGIRHFNGGMLYQSDPKFNNLELMLEFFQSFDGSACILSFKGCINETTFIPDSSPQFIDTEFVKIAKAFESIEKRPKIIFTIGRVDKTRPIEEVAKYLESKVEHDDIIVGWGISECGPETLSKAVAVAKVSLLELEISILTQDVINLGTLKIASDNKIPIIGYSPMAKGLLTEKGISPGYLESLNPSSTVVVFGFDRFKAENYEANYKYLKQLHDYAHSKKNCSLQQLALAYVSGLSGVKNFKGITQVTRVIPLPGSSKIENIDQLYTEITLSNEELFEIQEMIDSYTVQGGRYSSIFAASLNA